MIDIIALANRSVGAMDTGFDCNAMEQTGFSNTQIFKLRNSQGTFAIRSWPAQSDSWDKLVFWQACNRIFEMQPNGQVLRYQTPFPKIIPWSTDSNKSELLFHYQGALWSLCRWVAGHPIQQRDLSMELVRHLAEVLANIHKRTDRLNWNSGSASSLAISSSLTDRYEFLLKLDNPWVDNNFPKHWLRQHALEELVMGSLRNLFKLKAEWQRFLGSMASRSRICHWIVRDAWYSNVLIEDSKFAAIVDLGAARCDWPGLDFVRLIGSLVALAGNSTGFHAQVYWRTAWDAYSEAHPNHALESLDVCTLLDEISCGLSIAQWLQWVSQGRFAEVKSDIHLRIAQRIRELCTQFGNQ